ncbi:hypothetical protein Mapa_009501 [Marchantia paleacea]|nr:hypothetical protein Mapa_009501 [Marchantia paleacea]
MAGAALSLPHALSMLVPGVFCHGADYQESGAFECSATCRFCEEGALPHAVARSELFGNRFCSRTDSLSRCCSFPVSHCRVCQLLSFEAGGSRRLAPNSQRSTYGCGGGGHGLDKNCLIVRHNRKEVLDGCRSVGLNKLSFYKCGNSVSRVYASASDERVTIVGSSDEKTEKLQSDDEPLPTMEEIQEVAKEQGLKIEVRTLGPWFQINLMSADEKLTMGSAEGFETWWTEGKILHLESVRLTRDAPKGVSVLGPGFLVGAACVRYGLDKNCPKAELLAINDDETTHSKLVRYYSRLGFKAMYEVTGEGLTELADRVVWGGVGTRMDANCYQLLRKWAKVLRPKSKQAGLSSSKGFSSEKIQQKK